MSKNPPRRLALLNGNETHARKLGGRWLVGGDYPAPTDNVLIAALFKDWANGDTRWAWFKLNGSYLKFDDFMSPAEVDKNRALLAGEVQA